MYDPFYRVTQTIQVRSAFKNAVSLYQPSNLDSLARSLTVMKAQTFDSSFTEDVSHTCRDCEHDDFS